MWSGPLQIFGCSFSVEKTTKKCYMREICSGSWSFRRSFSLNQWAADLCVTLQVRGRFLCYYAAEMFLHVTMSFPPDHYPHYRCGVTFLRSGHCGSLSKNKCSFNFKQTSLPVFGFFFSFSSTLFAIFVGLNHLSHLYLQNSKRHFHSLTKTVMGPSPPKSWGLSCAPWDRIPQRRSCKIWSMRWMLTVRTGPASSTWTIHGCGLEWLPSFAFVCYQEMAR